MERFPETWATANLGGLSIEVQTSQYRPRPGAVAFVVPLEVCAEDMVAALWSQAMGVDDDADLPDLPFVRQLVAETLVNLGLDEINETRAEIEDMIPGSEAHARLQTFRTAVHAAFADVLTPAPAGTARELAGVV